MANIFLAWQNRADEGTLSGGTWLTSLPLTNMQNRQVQKVARSNGVTNAATQFAIDLGSARAIGVLGLVVHNMSVSAKVRITGAATTTAHTNLFTTFESAFDNAAWTKTNITVTADNTTAPDGTTTADALLATGGGGAPVYRDIALAGTSTVTHAIFLKAGSTGDASVQLEWRTGGTTQTASANIDLNTGTVSGVTGTASAITAYARDAGNGWWRVTLTGTGTNASNTVVRFIVSNNQVGRTIFAWGAFIRNESPMVYETGYIDVWPTGVIPQDLLEWEDDNFWLGTLTQAQRAGYQSPFIHRPDQVYTARYWRVEIYDSTNSDGYVQIGRLFMARGWTPSVNYSYGGSLAYQDPTPVDTSLSGAEYFDVRSKYRVLSFSLEYITETEAYSYALELQRLAGTSGEVLVMPDGGSDIGQQPLRSFVGRLSQIGAVSQPQPNTYSVNFEVKELL